jgi:hypothetical protein
MDLPRHDLVDASLQLAITSAAVANYCDHIEHNEIADVGTVRDAAMALRKVAITLSDLAGRDPVDLYAKRLAVIEQRNVLHSADSFDGEKAARGASSWRALQLVQVEHDHAYHGDVVGLNKSDQLHHYALHVAKVAGAAASVATGVSSQTDFVSRRVPDMLLFGLKLSTVTSEKLPETAVESPRHARHIQAVA